MRLLFGLQPSQVTARLRELIKQGPQQSLWIVPNERFADDLVARHNLVADSVVTFPRLANRFAGVAAADFLPKSHQRLLLDYALQQLDGKKQLTAFHPMVGQPGFIAALFSLVSEIRSLGLSAEKFREAAQEIYNQKIPPEIADTAAVLNLYEQLMKQHGWFDRALIYRLANDKSVKELPVELRRFRLLIIYGFAEFTQAQLELIQRLYERMAELIISLPSEAESSTARDAFEVTARTSAELHLRFPKCVDQYIPGTVDGRPAGIEHIADQLFASKTKQSKNAAGVQVIEGPGKLGEVKLVARAVKQLLLSGAQPDDVLVSVRDLEPYVNLLQEFFAEYGIPLDIEAEMPLLRQPAVVTLLKAARLSNDDWPFAETAALLRSNYFRPDWPELADDREIPLDSELLLRLIGEPKGREAFLNATIRHAKDLEPPLEDESAASQERLRKQKLAERCLPFLRHFLATWDTVPTNAPIDQFVGSLRSFADDIGIFRSAVESELVALEIYFNELANWAARCKCLSKRPAKIALSDFLHVATTIAGTTHLPRTTTGSGRVRIVPADLAAGLTCKHLFVIGLSERSFPNLSVGDYLLNEQERRRFREVGIDLNITADRLSTERLLFYRLVTSASHSLTLSYPALDEKGQQLLPASFLENVRELFVSQTITTTRRQMITDGIDDDPPLSLAEYRWRFAKVGGDRSAMPEDLVQHLATAKTMAQNRFEHQDFGAFDGLLQDSRITKDVERQFSSATIYSATSLERYVACPFKYFVDSVLKLQALPDPDEEIEATMRGSAYHRALARFHRQIQSPKGGLEDRLAQELSTAIAEYSNRSASPITKALWKLESERLQRLAQRYESHWTKFRDKCGNNPVPSHFEMDFGFDNPADALLLRVDGLEFRIGGRIDRIDVVDLGNGKRGHFIIDYKTGHPSNYVAKRVVEMQALQLPIYALGAERLADKTGSGEMLGAAYWFPGTGHKMALPRSEKAWLEKSNWPMVRQELLKWLATLVRRIRSGEFPLAPRDKEHCTATCDFSQMCRISQSRGLNKSWSLPLPIIESPTDE